MVNHKLIIERINESLRYSAPLPTKTSPTPCGFRILSKRTRPSWNRTEVMADPWSHEGEQNIKNPPVTWHDFHNASWLFHGDLYWLIIIPEYNWVVLKKNYKTQRKSGVFITAQVAEMTSKNTASFFYIGYFWKPPFRYLFGCVEIISTVYQPKTKYIWRGLWPTP